MAGRPTWYPPGPNNKIDWGGAWQSPLTESTSYLPYTLVTHEGGQWLCIAEATDAPTLGSPNWELFSESLLDIYDGAPISPLAGATQIVLSQSATNIAPVSPAFTVVSGELQARFDCLIAIECGFVWRAVMANNQDAGIVIFPLSALGSIPVDLPYGFLLPSPRALDNELGDSHNLGLVELLAGQLLRIEADSYPGQSGTTHLQKFELFCNVFPAI